MTHNEIRSADVFLTRAIEKILGDKEVKRDQNAQLKEQLESILTELRKRDSKNNSNSYIEIDDAERYFLPFELACKCKSPRVVETALDCIQKLVAHGYLNESSRMSTTSKINKIQLVQRVIKTICQCFDGPDGDDNVQLQIIKCLLTILTSPHIEIHEQTLLLPIKTCYNIQISSNALINQASARAALTQIINTVLSRLETSVKSNGNVDNSNIPTVKISSDSTQTKSNDTVDIANNSADKSSDLAQTKSSNDADSENNATEKSSEPTETKSINGEIENNATEEKSEEKSEEKNPDTTETKSNDNVDTENNETDKTSETTETETKPNNDVDSEVNSTTDKASDSATETQTKSNDSVDTSNNPADKSTDSTQTKPNNDIDSKNNATVKSPEPTQILSDTPDNPFEMDAFLMFRAFCKLSLRPVTNESATSANDVKSNIDIKSKILSLQLILATLKNAKTTFKQSSHVINAIKQYLCVSLTKNGVSPINEVFELSIAIFVSLMADYRQHLKKQIEVFFREIILFLLETSTSSFDHKWICIQALTQICANSQCVVDLYVNYDCDLQSTNIFDRLVNVLAKKAQCRQHADVSCNQTQQKALRLKGLECIVDILKSMVDWSSDLFVTSSTLKSDLGPENRPQLENEQSMEVNKIRSYDSNNSLHSSQSSNLNNIQTSAVNNFDQSSYDPNDFEAAKNKKELWEKGIGLFNKKPKKGIQFLQESELLGQTAEEIAEFFLKDDRLDKTAIGDFMGENEKFNKEVMYSYVDQMDFYGIEIVAALRLFLEGFRLPGEAQKIDRLMEKFAARYHELNKKFANMEPSDLQKALQSAAKKRNQASQKLLTNYYFESADTVYVLAFSIIMLATDLHSAQVKKKMTKENYINMNKGINENKDLPREFLEHIFDQVAESEIKVKGPITTNRSSQRSAENEKQRRLLYNMEIEQVTQTARSLMESVCHLSTNFTSAKHGEHITPMFKLAWTPFLAAFSIGLQDLDDPHVVELCLTGFKSAIRIACIFRLEVERDAYVQALSRFTLLTTQSHVTEMKLKNLEAIKVLIHVAHSDGNYLDKSWHEIIRCISKLEQAQSTGITILTPPTSFTLELSTINCNIQSNPQSMVVAIDRIFTGSVKLDGDAIVEFVRWLCHVSEDELQANPPRMYCLTKIVEISYYNMGRIRLQWTRIWNVLGEHFNKAGCNSNEEVAFFAVDSLRQLSMKFLEKGEFANFRFQKDFLKPFEHIMKRNSSFGIRDMVIQCIEQLLKAQAGNIKSGWKNIFGVFHLAASINDERILRNSFDVTSEVVRHMTDKYFHSMLDSFQDAVKCLSEFACNSSSPDISIEAIGLIRHFAVFVAERPDVFAEQQHPLDETVIKSIPESDLVWMKGWFPILFELSCIINRCKLDVRTRGLTVMFEIVKTYGEAFRPQWWKELFNIVFRIFDNMKLPESQIEKVEWMTTTCNHALYAIIDVFSQYYDAISDILIDDLYTHLKWCIKQDNEQLARSGTNCLENFIISNGVKFTEQVWKKTCLCLTEIFNSTLPLEILTWRPDQSDPADYDELSNSFNNIGMNNQNHHHIRKKTLSNGDDVSLQDHQHNNKRVSHSKIPFFNSTDSTEHSAFHYILIKCVVQLELIQTIDNIIFYPTTSKEEDLSYIAAAQALSSPTKQPVESFGEKMFRDDIGMYVHLTSDQLFTLIDCLQETYSFASKFNCNFEQRNLLWKAGFKGKDKPNLLKHETQSIACILRILFKMLNDESRNDHLSSTQEKLIKVCQSALHYYTILPSESHRESWDYIMLLMLTKIYKLDLVKFRNFTTLLYRHLCEVLSFNLKPELRTILREIFIRIGLVYSIFS